MAEEEKSGERGRATYGLKRELEFDITEERAPFAPEEQLGHYRVKRWTWFQKQQASDSALEIIDLKNNVTAWHSQVYYAHMMLRCVVDHPPGFKLELSYIEGELDPDVGDIVREACLEVNGISKEGLEAFLRMLKLAKGTPGSPSSGPAKT